MQNLFWVDKLPGETAEGGIEIANELYWNITAFPSGQEWYVYSGEKAVLHTDSREVVDAFLYGLGLAYAVLPEPVFTHLREEVKQWVE